MDATFLAKIKNDFPSLRFVEGPRFLFRPPRTVVYVSGGSQLLFLHELGHALTGLYDFKTEVERLKIEALAWEKAKELASNYGVSVDEDLIEEELDSYRDFLHQKSRCPECGLTRFQTPDGNWYCPRCVIF
jgi:hypothetical protein